jgi:hypothetical protein
MVFLRLFWLTGHTLGFNGGEKNKMRIICEVCKQEAYIQKLGNYYRCRHYVGKDSKTGKAKFYYHPQSKGYAETQIALIKKQENIKQQPIEQLSNLDQSNPQRFKLCFKRS